MKKSFLLGLSFVALVSFAACNNNKQAEQTTTTEDVVEQQEVVVSQPWEGTFEGTTPCADCEGIKTTIVLKGDNTYTRSEEYLGKGDNNKFEDNGTIEWNSNGVDAVLVSAAGDRKDAVRFQDGNLYLLDADGNIVVGELADKYILLKK